jgi:hypothetical protein
MWYGFMAAVGTMDMLGTVPGTDMVWGTHTGVTGVVGQDMLVYVVFMRVMQMPFMQVVDMPIVDHRRMATTWPMLVWMRTGVWVMFLRH